MSEEEKKAAQEKADAEAKALEAEAAEKAKQEKLEKDSKARKGRLLHAHKEIKAELAEMGVNPDEVDPPSLGDDEVLTVGKMKELERQKSQQTALELANNLEDSTERDAVKVYLSTRLIPSGNAQEDLRLALTIVHSERNGQIAQEVARKTAPKQHPTGGGAPARKPDAEFVPTPEELRFMAPPFNMTKDHVLAARARAGQS